MMSFIITSIRLLGTNYFALERSDIMEVSTGLKTVNSKIKISFEQAEISFE